MPSRLLVLFFGLFIAAFVFVSSPTLAKESQRSPLVETPDYIYYCTGNCNQDVNVPTTAGTVLMGGGLDVDAAFVWMIQRAQGGDFLVIRTDDDDTYDPYIYNLGPLNSAATLVILNRTGSFESFVNMTVSNAEALFFAGGDQFTYYYNWKDTPMGRIIQDKIDIGIPVGGTSAGEESSGQFMYTGQYTTTKSNVALKNPYQFGITFGTDFLHIPFLTSTICDAHFFQRDRMGRLMTFMGRMLTDAYSPNAILGVGVDEQTAVLINENGTADLVSWVDDGCAYFLQSTTAPQTCIPHIKLTFEDVQTFRACGNLTNIFDFTKWSGNDTVGIQYQLSANKGVLSSSNGQIY